ncbi:CehA/McbA family metallohydrolase [uncultured Sphaerochaeta sp.]|uniref:CehA/McbA family metallohydrolase n=1 Tax=uncultured Sphaerochaeta sp. TaxID=886478 RepID=UPI002A0A68A2|nr:CehA/McbA family metallohydrolase [uncultured Sphaerochaeta sp.]
MKYVFTLSFTQEQERTYREIPFSVPVDADCIRVCYSYSRFKEEIHDKDSTKTEVNIIDLGLTDPSGVLQGWSGSEKNEFLFSNYESTPGYRQSKVVEGEWKIALGIYKVTEQVSVFLEVEVVLKVSRWLKGDFHMHSINSDGRFTVHETIEMCKKANLDFIALTDHNNTEQNTEIGRPEGITVIRGMECTNYRGHANFFYPEGISYLGCNLLPNSIEAMHRILLEAQSKNVVISLNHIMDVHCPWTFGFDDIPYDMVEVWNGPMKQSEMDAIAWWHNRLKTGMHLSAIGGSDTHKTELFRTHGTPMTLVFSQSRDPQDILMAAKQGRVVITYAPQGPTLDLHIQNYGIGDEIVFEHGLEGTFVADGLREGDTVVLIDSNDNRTLYATREASRIQRTFIVPESKFVRAEIYRILLDKEILVALTNPIYIRK